MFDLLQIQTPTGELRYADTTVTIEFSSIMVGVSPPEQLLVADIRDAESNLVGQVRVRELLAYVLREVPTVNADDLVRIQA